LKFFFDRNIAVRLARMLSALDAQHQVVHQDDDPRFCRRSEDVFIIATLAAEHPKPVFLTADLNMRAKYPHERKALSESGLTLVFFRRTFHNLDFYVQAAKLVKIWPTIVAGTGRCRCPTAFEVTPNAKLVELGPTKSL
jgi:hypothetical protein